MRDSSCARLGGSALPSEGPEFHRVKAHATSPTVKSAEPNLDLGAGRRGAGAQMALAGGDVY